MQLGFLTTGNAAEAPLDANTIAQVQHLCAQYAISITALAYYDLAFNPPSSHAITPAYTRVFEAAEHLGVQVVASMSGFDAAQDWNGNIQLFADRFGPVADAAEKRGIRLAIENWMGFGGPLPHKPINMGAHLIPGMHGSTSFPQTHWD
jgi:sugar phosphate isomerase/epimerase